MVGPQGLEPRTDGLLVRRSNQLSYGPYFQFGHFKADLPAKARRAKAD